MPRNLRLSLDDDNIVTGITCPSTGKTVDLSNLSPEEKALCLMMACVDPETYDGTSPTDCIVGQPADLAQRQFYSPVELYLMTASVPETVSTLVGGAENDIRWVYSYAADEEYKDSLDAALQMAAAELHVDQYTCASLVAPLMEGTDQ